MEFKKNWLRAKKELTEWPAFFFKVNRKIHHLLISYSKNPNPVSSPYISGDTFRSLAQHVFDESKTFLPQEVAAEDIVFVKIDFTQSFFEKMHPLIMRPYTLITHNGDRAVDENLAKSIDSKIIRWYAQNVSVDNPKILPIPIGLENLDYYNHGVISRIKKIQQTEHIKKDAILFGFTLDTNPNERSAALSSLLKTKTAEQIKKRLTAKQYCKKLTEYKFVASPQGNGIDCHRTWEAMYLKTVPIVKNSYLTRFFYTIGLPLYLVEDWEEVCSLDEKKLAEIYKKLFPRFSCKALYFDYWQDIIINTHES